MQIALLALLGTLLALPALADANDPLPPEVVEKAVRMLPVGTHFRLFCARCGELTYDEEVVVAISMNVERGSAALQLNGRRGTSILFDVFLPDGERWTSVAQRLGLRAQDAPGELGAAPAKERLWELAGYWIGTIGSLDVQLQLNPAGTGLPGSYFYERVGELLELQTTRLSFTVGGPAELTMVEIPFNGGSYTGTWQGRLDSAQGSFTGIWTANTGSRTLPFSLRRLAKYVQVEDHTDLWTAAAHYPVLTETLAGRLTPVNAPLAVRAREFQREAVADLGGFQRPDAGFAEYFQPFTESMTLTVTYFRPGLVSLRESTYGYTGGAHGGARSSALTYALRDGVPVQLTLADVLRPGADIRERLVGVARTAVRRKFPELPDQAAVQLRDQRFDSFLASPNSLSLLIPLGNNWDPLGITLSPAEISGLLRPDGPLGFLIEAPRKPQR